MASSIALLQRRHELFFSFYCAALIYPRLVPLETPGAPPHPAEERVHLLHLISTFVNVLLVTGDFKARISAEARRGRPEHFISCFLHLFMASETLPSRYQEDGTRLHEVRLKVRLNYPPPTAGA